MPNVRRLNEGHIFLRKAEIALRDHGALYLGKVQTYSPDATARMFTDQFNTIVKTAGDWQAVWSKLERTKQYPVQSDIDAMAAGGFKLGTAINRFNRAAWWESPSTAALAIKAPFQVAGAVAAGLAKIVVQTGHSLVGGLNFVSNNMFILLIGGAAVYFFGPMLLAKLIKGNAK